MNLTHTPFAIHRKEVSEASHCRMPKGEALITCDLYGPTSGALMTTLKYDIETVLLLQKPDHIAVPHNFAKLLFK